jgi:hypothetical protein
VGWLPTLAWAGGLVALIASPWLLSRAWRRGDEGRVERASGWLALLASMVMFAIVIGPASGIALALIGLPLPALALVWWHRNRHPVVLPATRRPASNADPARSPLLAGWLRVAARVFIALPLALLAVMSLATQMSYLAHSVTMGIVIALVLAVVLWAVAAWWTFADPKPWRPAAGLVLLALTSGLPLWLR